MVVGLVQDIQRVSDPDEAYIYRIVKCQECGASSEQFLSKSYLGAEEHIDYIIEATGFVINKSKGGLNCKKCDRRTRIKGV